MKLGSQLFEAFSNASMIFLEAFNDGTSLQSREAEKAIMAKIRDMFDGRFRENGFVTTLADSVESSSNLANVTGFGQLYQNLSNIASIWNNVLLEPLRDALFRTPSHKEYQVEKYSLRHYYPIVEEMNQTPVLIIYAFINRHYVLDLLPHISVVRNLLSQGFDVFATDWGTPGAYDKELTIGHFVNNYMDSSVDLIREHTKSDKVSLFGYCWGGDLALIYAALHPEKVKNVITVATPGDFSLDDGLLSVWTRSLNVDAVLSAFGNAPSTLLNTAFALRSPIDYLHKYPHFLEEPQDFGSIAEFFATQIWLNDSPPVIGEIFRQFVKDCYQKNLLIKNQLEVGALRVNLRNVTMPFLNVVASKDDLVAPESSKALNDAVGSADKNLIEFQSGHVGLLTSSRAHKELWAKVGSWLKQLS
jgi:class III poly(R)-hydroxyalkanoic acid synthase PhaC subunit